MLLLSTPETRSYQRCWIREAGDWKAKNVWKIEVDSDSDTEKIISISSLSAGADSSDSGKLGIASAAIHDNESCAGAGAEPEPEIQENMVEQKRRKWREKRRGWVKMLTEEQEYGGRRKWTF